MCILSIHVENDVNVREVSSRQVHVKSNVYFYIFHDTYDLWFLFIYFLLSIYPSICLVLILYWTGISDSGRSIVFRLGSFGVTVRLTLITTSCHVCHFTGLCVLSLQFNLNSLVTSKSFLHHNSHRRISCLSSLITRN